MVFANNPTDGFYSTIGNNEGTLNIRTAKRQCSITA
jgi:hypothetical protein